MATPVRPGPSPTASPSTPRRGISSTFSSPGSVRPEDDAVIFEIGSRYFRAGLAGDSAPRCTFGFGPEESRRVGDYRPWLPDHEKRVRQVHMKDWGLEHELMTLGLQDADLDLFEDKIERSARKAYAQFLLTDAKSKKAALVVPTSVSHTLLSRVLSILFNNFRVPSIMLLSPPVMTVIAAGQRSGIVVDIGWHETTISAVYELREIRQFKSTRAMKQLTKEAGKFFLASLESQETVGKDEDKKMILDFSYIEELITRVIWCQTANSSTSGDPVSKLGIAAESTLSIPLPKSSDSPVKIPFSTLRKPVETALFASTAPPREQDDHEHPLHYLLYETLMALSPDVRSVCMSRIMFTGGGASIIGLKTRLLNDLISTVELRGWAPVWGKAAEEQRRRKKEQILKNLHPNIASSDKLAAAPNTQGAASEDQLPDPIMDKVRQQGAKTAKPNVSGIVRGIETLGAWTGASLAIMQRDTSSVAEIDREMFLQHGLTGAKKDSDLNVAKPKTQTGPIARYTAVDTAGWTLGAWA